MSNQARRPDRRCAFNSKRPDRFPIFENGCQFTGDVDDQLPDLSGELIEHKGVAWCPFHLPSDYWKENKHEQYLLGQQVSDKIVELAKRFRSDDAYYSLDLTGTVFPSGVRFENISFGSIIFKGCEFLSHLSFKDCKFQYYIHFDDAQFHDDASFFECIFDYELVFSQAQFINSLRISKTKTSEIRSHGTKFFENIWFSDFSINGKFDLSSSKFFKNLGLYRLESVDEIVMINSEISNGLSIHECQAAHVSLAKAKLLGQINFKGQQFCSLNIHDATFGDAQELSMMPPDTTCRRAGRPDWAEDPKYSLHRSRASLCFDDVVFKGASDFSASHSVGQNPEANFPKISFKAAKFQGDVSFENRVFGSLTSFQEAEFSHAPNFHNCTLHQGTSFYRAEFLDYKRIKRLPKTERTQEAESATRAFRALKLASESTRARQEQSRFFAEEERRNRLDPDTPKLVIFTSWLYEIISDYGRSFFRPGLWWFAAQVAFFLTYKAILTDGTPTRSDLAIVLRLTLQQIFRPFEFLRLRSVESNELGQTYLQNLSIDISQIPILFLGILGVFQSILAVSLLALFLFALRRRFKLD